MESELEWEGVCTNSKALVSGFMSFGFIKMHVAGMDIADQAIQTPQHYRSVIKSTIPLFGSSANPIKKSVILFHIL